MDRVMYMRSRVQSPVMDRVIRKTLNMVAVAPLFSTHILKGKHWLFLKKINSNNTICEGLMKKILMSNKLPR